jgi:hypothetical protein
MLYFVIESNICIKKCCNIMLPFILGGCVVISICYMLNLHIFEICWYCIRNNYRFFQEAGRSSFWVIVNYLDYFLFIGVIPIVFLLIFSVLKPISFMLDKRIKNISISYIITLILLFFSSFSRGEMGRLLLLFVPFNIFLTSYGVQIYSYIKKETYYWGLLAIICSLLQLFLIRIILKTVVIF